MEDDQPPTGYRFPVSNQLPKNPRWFRFGSFLLWLVLACLLNVVLAVLVPIVLFAASGFDIHGSISTVSGLPVYCLLNFAGLVYAGSKGRSAWLGFLSGAVLASLVMWPLLSH